MWISTHPRVISGIALNSRGLGGISRTGSISNSYMDSSSILPDQSMSMTMPVSRLRVAKLATYSLQGSYDKFVTLPSLEGRATDQHTVFVPQHVDTELSLATSFLGGRVRGPVGDMGLQVWKSSRVGWGTGWDLVSVGRGITQEQERGGKSGGGFVYSCNIVMVGCLGSVSVTVVEQTTCVEMDRQQLECWVDWFKVSLATNVRVENSDQEGAAFAPQSSLDTVHSDSREMARQMDQF